MFTTLRSTTSFGRGIRCGFGDGVVSSLFRDTILFTWSYTSARKHGIDELNILHALGHSVASGEQDDGKVLYLGPDRSGNLLEVVSVLRDDGTEIVIHAMRMRRIYESFRHDKGDPE